MSNFSRIFLIVLLLATAAFCAFGFMATFEPGQSMLLRIVYGAAVLFCMVGIGWLFAAKEQD